MRCPNCGKNVDSLDAPTLPFCSDRCRTIDLGRWLDEKYSVPVVEPPDEEDEPPPPAEHPPED